MKSAELGELLKDKVFQKKLAKSAEYLSAIVFGAFCTIYALMFRSYKLAVEHHQKLTDLMSDSRVRVAHGDSAKQLLSIVKAE